MGNPTEAQPAETMTDRADHIIETPEALGIPWIDSPFFLEQLEAADASDAIKEHARNFHRDGYVVLEGFFDSDLIERVLDDYDRIFAADTAYNADPEKDARFKRDPTRRQDAWIVSDAVYEMACHPDILGLLGFLYRRRPIPFQTLNFHTGTEQSIHSDAIHFDSLPTGFMCGVWVALEDMTHDNGALRYYPGSHRLPVISTDQLGVWANTPLDDLGPEYELYEDWVRALIRGCKLEERELTCPKGSALIWASNLLHGGSPIRKPGSTRFSQVTHYYFENCLYFTPIHSNSVAGELRLKSVFDITTRQDVPHTINGMELDLIAGPNRNHRIGPAGSLAGLALTSPERDGTIVKVLEALQHQATQLLADRKTRPAERAVAMARLCEVALKAIDARRD